MARSPLTPYADDILAMYGQGISACQIAKHFSVCTTTITNFLIKHKAMPYVSKAERSKNSQEKKAKIVELYLQGFSPKELHGQGFGENLIWTALNEARIEKRGQPKGHGAHPVENYIKGRITREQRQVGIIKSEALIGDKLRESGITNVTFQKAIYTYSCDLVVENPRVAIECVCRGTIPLYFSKGVATKKIKKFGELGWHVYFLLAQDMQDISFFGINDLVSWIQFLKSAPTLRRQYRVFRCGTDLLATGCCDCDNIPEVWPFGHAS